MIHIEPSTLVLSIVNFFILMAVLHFLLIKPLMKVVHDREDKINTAKAHRDSSAEQLEEQNRRLVSSLDDTVRAEKDSLAARLEQVNAENAEIRRASRESEDKRQEEAYAALAEEQKKMEAEFESRLPEFAKTLADRLVSREY